MEFEFAFIIYVCFILLHYIVSDLDLKKEK